MAEYQGYQTLVARDREKNITHRVLSVPRDSFLSEVSKLDFNPKLDYYYTPNTFKNPYTYKTDRLLGLRQFTVDVDMHGTRKLARPELINTLAYAIAQDSYKVPYTSIINTGRGLQIVIELEQTSYKLEWLYKLVAKEIANLYIETVKEFKKDYEVYDYIEVDVPVTLKASGLVRLKGSTNTISKTKVKELYKNNALYSLNELKDMLGIKVGKQAYNELKNAPNGFKLALGTSRQKQIEKIGIIEVGNRNNTLYLMYNNLIMYMDKDQAEAKVREHNKSHTEAPLSDREMQGIINSVNRFGHRYYTQDNFYSLLGIDKPITYRAKRVMKRKAKESRSQEIINLLNTTSKTHQEIADLMGVSKRTIANICKDNGITHAVRKRRLLGLKQCAKP